MSCQELQAYDRVLRPVDDFEDDVGDVFLSLSNTHLHHVDLKLQLSGFRGEEVGPLVTFELYPPSPSRPPALSLSLPDALRKSCPPSPPLQQPPPTLSKEQIR